MTRKFIAEEINYYRSQCNQEREELAKAIKNNDWRMISLAQNNLEQATRQYLRMLDLAMMSDRELADQ